MHLQDYFVGQPIRLMSRHSPRIVAERINAAAGSRFWPFYSDTVVGGVWFDRIRLRFVRSPIDYKPKPLLAGRLREAPYGSILTLRYRAPIWAYVFYPFWLCVLGLAILMMLGQFGERNPDLTNGDLAFVWALLLTMFVAPFALHYEGTRHSEKELGYLLDFLAERVEALP